MRSKFACKATGLGGPQNMATIDITNAAKELTKLEGKLERIQGRATTAIAKATAKATKLYAEKVATAQKAVAEAKATLQALAAKA